MREQYGEEDTVGSSIAQDGSPVGVNSDSRGHHLRTMKYCEYTVASFIVPLTM